MTLRAGLAKSLRRVAGWLEPPPQVREIEDPPELSGCLHARLLKINGVVWCRDCGKAIEA